MMRNRAAIGISAFAATVLVATACSDPKTPRAPDIARVTDPTPSVAAASPIPSVPAGNIARTQARRGHATVQAGTDPRLPQGSVVASPEGRASGAGTTARPLDLATALSEKGPLRPGGTLLLRGGTYKGTFVSTLAGTPKRPIVVRSYPGEWAVLDGGHSRASTLDVQGPDVWFRDFEVTKSDRKRLSRYRSNAPPDVSRARWSGVWVEGARTKLINLVVHDNGDGIGMWRRSVDSEIYGCITFNNGWLGSDHAWGHGIYVQNAAGTKSLADNMVFNNFGWGVHAYDSLGPITGIDIVGTTSFGNGVPAGRSAPNVLVGSERGPTDRISLRDSVLYHAPGAKDTNALLGYENEPGLPKQRGSVVVEGNHIVGGSKGLAIRGWSRATVERNLVFAAPKGSASPPRVTQLVPNDRLLVRGSDAYRWNHNAYRTAGSSEVAATAFAVKANGRDRSMSFEEWQETTGFDGASTYSVGPPRTNAVIVRPNRYERGRAFVTVLNWRNHHNATVDLAAAGLEIGDKFEIRDVQNLKGKPVVRGTYRGGAVSIPFDATNIAQPIGGSVAELRHTSKEFNAFLVLPRDD